MPRGPQAATKFFHQSHRDIQTIRELKRSIVRERQRGNSLSKKMTALQTKFRKFQATQKRKKKQATKIIIESVNRQMQKKIGQNIDSAIDRSMARFVSIGRKQSKRLR